MKNNTQMRQPQMTLRTVLALLTLSSVALARAGFNRVETGQTFPTRTGDGCASWGDYDGDGDVDLFVTLGQDGFNSLYRNLGGGVFDRPGEADIGDLASDNRVAVQGVWVDLNNDGYLDLYVSNRRIAPTGNRDLANDHLYWNDGHGSFRRQEVLGTSDDDLLPHGASLVDFDNDGDLDLFEPTFKGSQALPEAIFRHDGDGHFSRLDMASAPHAHLPNNAAWADFDGDGDLDVVVANNDLSSTAYILENRLSESGAAGFRPITGGPDGRGIDLTTSGAVLWGDWDNDGDLDLVTTHDDSGFRIHRRNAGGMYDSEPYSRPGGHGVLFATGLDAENDGDLDLLAMALTGAGTQEYRLLINPGDGSTFTEEVFAADQPYIWSSAPAVGDFDNDGYSDAFIVYGGTTSALYQNDGGDNHWLKLALKGTASNSSAVGAIVRVKATIGGKEVWQMRQVAAGGETFHVQHDIRPNFGLGDTTVAEVVRIE